MKELEASLDRCGMDHEDFRPLEVSQSPLHGPAAHSDCVLPCQGLLAASVRLTRSKLHQPQLLAVPSGYRDAFAGSLLASRP